ncbi:MAG: hypothetical protein IJ282_11125 [Lachnospiraceae bacterium]|nr:hypothetical protein [Lachnospiraceae bacterium]
MEERRVCKKCLTREMEGQEMVFQNMRDYIDNLEEDIKADSVLYESRLSVCKTCDNLLQGMCRSCGCYVEMRAAVTKNSCPWKKW